MYAVFQTGGKQYRALKGEIVRIEKMDYDPDQSMTWDGVAVSADGLHKVVVHAQPIGVFKEDKVIIFKKKRRHNYRRKLGHRQQLLRVKITDVVQVSS